MCVRMARISPLVSLAADDLEQVVRWEAAPSTPQQVALRCRLVLAAASGKQDLEIASIYDGLIAEVDVMPWQNLRLQFQYVAYDQFNGSSSNYDGFGRRASDNNTLYILTWLLY